MWSRLAIRTTVAVAHGKSGLRDLATAVGDKQVRMPNTSVLEQLVCPLSKGPLVYNAASHELFSPHAGVAYLVLPDGTPNLIPLAGRVLSAEETASAKALLQK